MKSYIDELKELLEEIEKHFTGFYKDISIQRLDNDPYSPFVLIGPNLCYDTNISDEQKRKQMYLLNSYKEWEEHFGKATFFSFLKKKINKKQK